MPDGLRFLVGFFAIRPLPFLLKKGFLSARVGE